MAAITTVPGAAQGTTRRSFIKLSAATAAALGTYGLLAWAPRAEGRDHTIDLFITAGEATTVDGLRVPVRTYSPVEDGDSLPGPLLLVAERDRLRIAITNTLDTPHGFAIDGLAAGRSRRARPRCSTSSRRRPGRTSTRTRSARLSTACSACTARR